MVIKLNRNQLTILNENINKINIDTIDPIDIKIINCTVNNGININLPNGTVILVGKELKQYEIIDKDGKYTSQL